MAKKTPKRSGRPKKSVTPKTPVAPEPVTTSSKRVVGKVKTSGVPVYGPRHQQANELELMMECDDEELSPAQLAAIQKAQEEHEKANDVIKAARAGNTLVPSTQPNTFNIVAPAPRPQPVQAQPPAPKPQVVQQQIAAQPQVAPQQVASPRLQAPQQFQTMARPQGLVQAQPRPTAAVRGPVTQTQAPMLDEIIVIDDMLPNQQMISQAAMPQMVPGLATPQQVYKFVSMAGNQAPAVPPAQWLIRPMVTVTPQQQGQLPPQFVSAHQQAITQVAPALRKAPFPSSVLAPKLPAPRTAAQKLITLKPGAQKPGPKAARGSLQSKLPSPNKPIVTRQLAAAAGTLEEEIEAQGVLPPKKIVPPRKLVKYSENLKIKIAHMALTYGLASVSNEYCIARKNIIRWVETHGGKKLSSYELGEGDLLEIVENANLKIEIEKEAEMAKIKVEELKRREKELAKKKLEKEAEMAKIKVEELKRREKELAKNKLGGLPGGGPIRGSMQQSNTDNATQTINVGHIGSLSSGKSALIDMLANRNEKSEIITTSTQRQSTFVNHPLPQLTYPHSVPVVIERLSSNKQTELNHIPQVQSSSATITSDNMLASPVLIQLSTTEGDRQTVLLPPVVHTAPSVLNVPRYPSIAPTPAPTNTVKIHFVKVNEYVPPNLPKMPKLQKLGSISKGISLLKPAQDKPCTTASKAVHESDLESHPNPETSKPMQRKLETCLVQQNAPQVRGEKWQTPETSPWKNRITESSLVQQQLPKTSSEKRHITLTSPVRQQLNEPSLVIKLRPAASPVKQQHPEISSLIHQSSETGKVGHQILDSTSMEPCKSENLDHSSFKKTDRIDSLIAQISNRVGPAVGQRLLVEKAPSLQCDGVSTDLAVTATCVNKDNSITTPQEKEKLDTVSHVITFTRGNMVPKMDSITAGMKSLIPSVNDKVVKDDSVSKKTNADGDCSDGLESKVGSNEDDDCVIIDESGAAENDKSISGALKSILTSPIFCTTEEANKEAEIKSNVEGTSTAAENVNTTNVPEKFNYSWKLKVKLAKLAQHFGVKNIVKKYNVPYLYLVKWTKKYESTNLSNYEFTEGEKLELKQISEFRSLQRENMKKSDFHIYIDNPEERNQTTSAHVAKKQVGRSLSVDEQNIQSKHATKGDVDSLEKPSVVDSLKKPSKSSNTARKSTSQSTFLPKKSPQPAPQSLPTRGSAQTSVQGLLRTFKTSSRLPNGVFAPASSSSSLESLPNEKQLGDLPLYIMVSDETNNKEKEKEKLRQHFDDSKKASIGTSGKSGPSKQLAGGVFEFSELLEKTMKVSASTHVSSKVKELSNTGTNLHNTNAEIETDSHLRNLTCFNTPAKAKPTSSMTPANEESKKVDNDGGYSLGFKLKVVKSARESGFEIAAKCYSVPTVDVIRWHDTLLKDNKKLKFKLSVVRHSEIYSVDEAAKLFDISKEKINKWIKIIPKGFSTASSEVKERSKADKMDKPNREDSNKPPTGTCVTEFRGKMTYDRIQIADGSILRPRFHNDKPISPIKNKRGSQNSRSIEGDIGAMPRLIKPARGKDDVEIKSTWGQIQSYVQQPKSAKTKKFSPDFKAKIIRLCDQQGQKTVANDHRIPYNKISRWRLKFKHQDAAQRPGSAVTSAAHAAKTAVEKLTPDKQKIGSTQKGMADKQTIGSTGKIISDKSGIATTVNSVTQGKSSTNDPLKIKIKLSDNPQFIKSGTSNKRPNARMNPFIAVVLRHAKIDGPTKASIAYRVKKRTVLHWMKRFEKWDSSSVVGGGDSVVRHTETVRKSNSDGHKFGTSSKTAAVPQSPDVWDQDYVIQKPTSGKYNPLKLTLSPRRKSTMSIESSKEEEESDCEFVEVASWDLGEGGKKESNRKKSSDKNTPQPDKGSILNKSKGTEDDSFTEIEISDDSECDIDPDSESDDQSIECIVLDSDDDYEPATRAYEDLQGAQSPKKASESLLLVKTPEAVTINTAVEVALNLLKTVEIIKAAETGAIIGTSSGKKSQVDYAIDSQQEVSVESQETSDRKRAEKLTMQTQETLIQKTQTIKPQETAVLTSITHAKVNSNVENVDLATCQVSEDDDNIVEGNCNRIEHSDLLISPTDVPNILEEFQESHGTQEEHHEESSIAEREKSLLACNENLDKSSTVELEDKFGEEMEGDLTSVDVHPEQQVVNLLSESSDEEETPSIPYEESLSFRLANADVDQFFLGATFIKSKKIKKTLPQKVQVKKSESEGVKKASALSKRKRTADFEISESFAEEYDQSLIQALEESRKMSEMFANESTTVEDIVEDHMDETDDGNESPARNKQKMEEISINKQEAQAESTQSNELTRVTEKNAVIEKTESITSVTSEMHGVGSNKPEGNQIQSNNEPNNKPLEATNEDKLVIESQEPKGENKVSTTEPDSGKKPQRTPFKMFANIMKNINISSIVQDRDVMNKDMDNTDSSSKDTHNKPNVFDVLSPVSESDVNKSVDEAETKTIRSGFSLFGNLMKKMKMPPATSLITDVDKQQTVEKKQEIEEPCDTVQDKGERNLFSCLTPSRIAVSSEDVHEPVKHEEKPTGIFGIFEAVQNPILETQKKDYSKDVSPTKVKSVQSAKPVFKFPKLSLPASFGKIAKFQIGKQKEAKPKGVESKPTTNVEDVALNKEILGGNTSNNIVEGGTTLTQELKDKVTTSENIVDDGTILAQELKDKDEAKESDANTSVESGEKPNSISDGDHMETSNNLLSECATADTTKVSDDNSHSESATADTNQVSEAIVVTNEDVQRETFQEFMDRLERSESSMKSDEEMASSTAKDVIEKEIEISDNQQHEEFYTSFSPEKIILILNISKKHGIDFAATSFGLPPSAIVNWIIKKDRKRRQVVATDVPLEKKLQAVDKLMKGEDEKLEQDKSDVLQWKSELSWLLESHGVLEVLEKWEKVQEDSSLDESVNSTATDNEMAESLVSGNSEVGEEMSAPKLPEILAFMETVLPKDFTLAQKAIAVMLGDKFGQSVVCHRTGINSGTLYNWKHHKQIRQYIVEQSGSGGKKHTHNYDKTKTKTKSVVPEKSTIKLRRTVSSPSAVADHMIKEVPKEARKATSISSPERYTKGKTIKEINPVSPIRPATMTESKKTPDKFKSPQSRGYRLVSPTKVPAILKEAKRTATKDFTVEQRVAIVKLVELYGVRTIHKQFKLPTGSIWNWQHSKSVLDVLEKEKSSNDTENARKKYYSEMYAQQDRTDTIDTIMDRALSLIDDSTCHRLFNTRQRADFVCLVQYYGIQYVCDKLFPSIPKGTVWNWRHNKKILAIVEKKAPSLGINLKVDDNEMSCSDDTVDKNSETQRWLKSCQLSNRKRKCRSLEGSINLNEGNSREEHTEKTSSNMLESRKNPFAWCRTFDETDGGHLSDNSEFSNVSDHELYEEIELESDEERLQDTFKHKKSRLEDSLTFSHSVDRSRASSPLTMSSGISVHSNGFEEILSEDEILTPSVSSRNSRQTRSISSKSSKTNTTGNAQKASKSKEPGTTRDLRRNNPKKTELSNSSKTSKAGNVCWIHENDDSGTEYEAVAYSIADDDRLYVRYTKTDGDGNIILPSKEEPSKSPSVTPVSMVKRAATPPQKRAAVETSLTALQKQKPRQAAGALANKKDVLEEMDASGNWVPLDEYYYGKLEGDSTYKEAKGEYRFKCWYCNKMLYNNVRTMQHIQGHIDSSKQHNIDLSDLTQCKNCYKQFDTPFEMQTHVEKVHLSNKVLMCRICEKDMPSPKFLSQHMRQNHVACEMPYVCHLCTFKSSMYSDVVDHFKKKHDSSQQLLCLYCLRTFPVKFVTQGWGQTQTYYGHLLKHQSKTSTKKCLVCRLMFFNSQDVKLHRKNHHVPNHIGGIGGKFAIQDSSTAESDADTAKQKSSKLKSLNAPSISKIQDYSDVQLPTGLEKSNCVECRQSMSSVDHFKKHINCSMCRFATSCSIAYANHMMGFHSGQMSSLNLNIPWERALPQPMFCQCGTSSKYGNRIANHLALCAFQACYTTKQDATEGGGAAKTQDGAKKSGGIFDALGLMKRKMLTTRTRVTASDDVQQEDKEWSPPATKKKRVTRTRERKVKTSPRTAIKKNIEAEVKTTSKDETVVDTKSDSDQVKPLEESEDESLVEKGETKDDVSSETADSKVKPDIEKEDDKSAVKKDNSVVDIEMKEEESSEPGKVEKSEDNSDTGASVDHKDVSESVELEKMEHSKPITETDSNKAAETDKIDVGVSKTDQSDDDLLKASQSEEVDNVDEAGTSADINEDELLKDNDEIIDNDDMETGETESVKLAETLSDGEQPDIQTEETEKDQESEDEVIEPEKAEDETEMLEETENVSEPEPETEKPGSTEDDEEEKLEDTEDVSEHEPETVESENGEDEAEKMEDGDVLEQESNNVDPSKTEDDDIENFEGTEEREGENVEDEEDENLEDHEDVLETEEATEDDEVVEEPEPEPESLEAENAEDEVEHLEEDEDVLQDESETVDSENADNDDEEQVEESNDVLEPEQQEDVDEDETENLEDADDVEPEQAIEPDGTEDEEAENLEESEMKDDTEEREEDEEETEQDGETNEPGNEELEEPEAESSDTRMEESEEKSDEANSQTEEPESAETEGKGDHSGEPETTLAGGERQSGEVEERGETPIKEKSPEKTDEQTKHHGSDRDSHGSHDNRGSQHDRDHHQRDERSSGSYSHGDNSRHHDRGRDDRHQDNRSYGSHRSDGSHDNKGSYDRNRDRDRSYDHDRRGGDSRSYQDNRNQGGNQGYRQGYGGGNQGYSGGNQGYGGGNQGGGGGGGGGGNRGRGGYNRDDRNYNRGGSNQNRGGYNQNQNYRGGYRGGGGYY